MCHDCETMTCNGECHRDEFYDTPVTQTNMDAGRLARISARLQSVQDNHAWTFNPKHEMFMGTTNAIVMWDRNLDLGRNSQHWQQSTDPCIKGYVLAPGSIKQNALTQALGAFLENCREDIEYLLTLLQPGAK